jgi:soluble lytic murein transglycosylase
VEAAVLEASTGAVALRSKAAALDPTLPRELSPDERVKRARALVDGGHADKALKEIDALIGALPSADRASPLACHASSVRGLATAKSPSQKKPAVADAWGDAIRACATEPDALVSALFSGAKASAAAQKPDEALERYGRVEKEFPKHRLADDARLASAIIVQGRDEGRAETMLLALPDDYPEGDMRSEALFRVALARMERGDWEGAKAPLDRAALIDAGTSHWATAGRAAYFRAKCAAKTGDGDDAKRRWVDVIKTHPMAYYMAQAYGRVSEVDAALARTTLSASAAAEADGPFLTHEHPEMATPAFARALTLLEVGEIDWARKELLASGATADGADSELVWTAASLLDRAGAFDAGHAFARGRLGDHLAHFPSGRWRFAWQTAYPRAFDPLVTRAANEATIPAALVWGVMREESAFIADVRSPSNAHGLMQLLPSTARDLARGTTLGTDEASLHQPQVSITLGVKLLAQLRMIFKDNPSLAIASYNAGLGAVNGWLRARPSVDFDLWVELIPFEETRGYVKRVLGSQLTYATLYTPATAKEVLELPAHPRASNP